MDCYRGALYGDASSKGLSDNSGSFKITLLFSKDAVFKESILVGFIVELRDVELG